MIQLNSIMLKPVAGQETAVFPFSVPAIQTLSEISFISPVTFLVGENGSGKSTLLEAIAYTARAITIGSDAIETDHTLASTRRLANQLRLSWRIKTYKGFFLRAEDFFGYTKRLSQMQTELEQELQKVDEEYEGRSEYAKGLARMPYAGQLKALKEKYGRNLQTYSHGESFLQLFQSRFVPNGLYLLDEPEAPLSPTRQLTLISLMKQMVEQNCQFIIATHSPILMAFPQATILNFDTSPIQPVAYEELEHVLITKTFLNNPQQYLQHL